MSNLLLDGQIPLILRKVATLESTAYTTWKWDRVFSSINRKAKEFMGKYPLCVDIRNKRESVLLGINGVSSPFQVCTFES